VDVAAITLQLVHARARGDAAEALSTAVAVFVAV
jgi:hypothetical protein